MKNIDLKFTKCVPVEQSMYPGLNESSYILKKGTVVKEGAMPLPCDVLVEQDVPVALRDGVVIRVDVFRPTDTADCPVIMWYAPYGKRGGILNLDVLHHPARMDVPKEWEDGLNAFEAPNPSYWVSHGYAVISPDPRGVGSSEGYIYAWGTQQTEDEYDLVEWAAAQSWSNGKVGTTGTSYLAMTQYAIAAAQPPHLAAIAPWEGALSPYESMGRGGIKSLDFFYALSRQLYSNQGVEDVGTMALEHPFFDEYWSDKEADLSAINIPAYIVASWTNVLHTEGSIKAYRGISSKEKWLRVSNTHEWTDYYCPENVEDLRKFFDHYLKGINNDWTSTPKVRLSVLNPGHQDEVNRVEDSYPLKNQGMEVLYLSDEGGELSLRTTPQAEESCAVYDVENLDGIHFDFKFDKATEFIGNYALKLYVEADGNNDMDIYAYLRKRDVNGVIVETFPVKGSPFVGPNGQLRVSFRELDKKLSTPLEPILTRTSEKKLAEHEIVEIEIPFWPYGMRWEAGETLELQICPIEKIVRPEMPMLPPAKTLNKGKHIIHFGGKYDSQLRLPIINAPTENH